jgi:hypothetical protein
VGHDIDGYDERNTSKCDSVAEWSKALDSSSNGANRVGSNPTAVMPVIIMVTPGAEVGAKVGLASFRSRAVVKNKAWRY